MALLTEYGSHDTTVRTERSGHDTTMRSERPQSPQDENSVLGNFGFAGGEKGYRQAIQPDVHKAIDHFIGSEQRWVVLYVTLYRAGDLYVTLYPTGDMYVTLYRLSVRDPVQVPYKLQYSLSGFTLAQVCPIITVHQLPNSSKVLSPRYQLLNRWS